MPYTRIAEHKHFELKTCPQTVITREYPDDYNRDKTPYYPIRDAANAALFERYQALATSSGILLGGRLATYQYFDMHQVVAQALAMARRECGGEPAKGRKAGSKRAVVADATAKAPGLRRAS